jgi:hypothetical protein
MDCESKEVGRGNRIDRDLLGILQLHEALRGTETLGVGICVDSDSPTPKGQKLSFGIVAFFGS